MKFGSSIRGVGVYLPDQIRRNDFWPADVVAHWASKPNVLEQLSQDCLEGAEYIHPILRAELSKVATDPFNGLKERRVAPVEMRPSEMEALAAREAISAAGIAAERITMLMDWSLPEDYYLLPNAPRVQKMLGLTNATAFGVQAYCFSLMKMVSIAHQFVASGAHEYVLCVASCKYSDLMDYSTSVSMMSGDAAAAFLIGRCEPGKGILGVVEKSQGEYQDAMRFVMRRPANARAADYDFARQDDYRFYFTPVDRRRSTRMIAQIPAWTENSCKPVLAQAGWRVGDVDLLVTNAVAAWYAAVVAKVLEIDMSKVEDNVLRHNNAGPTAIGLNVYEALRKGRIKSGSKVLLFGHGGGANYGAIALEWT